MTGSTCVVQCHNNKSNQRAGIFLHWSPASWPAMEKRTMFLLTHSGNFNPRGILITSRTSFSRTLFMSQDPRGRSFHCPFQLYGKKDRKKRNIICANKTKGNLPNLITQLKWQFVSSLTHPPLCKTDFLLTYFEIYYRRGKPFQFCRLLARRSSANAILTAVIKLI